MAVNSRVALLSGISLLTLSAVTAPATAQDAVLDTTLDPIVIFGEKIDRSYLDTTTSVGVVTAEELDDYAVQTVFDGFNRLANVRNLNTDGGSDTFSIRGLNGDGVAEIANPVPLVSVIIDGAVQNSEGTRRGIRSTWDLKQVEVLRGPQSSLYGRAALAGALVIESKDPSYDFEAAVKGNLFDLGRGGAIMLSGPILENQLAFRVSGEGLWGRNDLNFADPGNEFFGKDEFHNIRAKLLFEPDALPGLRALFTFNHAFDSPDTTLVSGPDFFDRTFAADSFFSESRETEVENYIWNVSYEFSKALLLRSISTVTDTELAIGSVPTSPLYFREDSRVGDDFTQDVRLEITDKEGTGITGVIGAFYGDFTQNIDSNILVDTGIALGGAPSFVLGVFQAGTFNTDIETAAAYADLRYNFFGGWSLIGGLRYQNDKVRTASNTNSDFFGPTVFDIEAEFDVWLPKFGLAYEFNESNSLAFTVSRGYRSGFTELDSLTATQNDVEPEFVWTYELAYRYVFSDNATTFGINAFFNEYDNQQITVITTAPFTRTSNVGRSESYGLEVEGRHNFDNGLKVFGSLGLVKTEILDFADPDCVPSGGNCAGNEFPEAPNVTLAFGGIYEHHSGLFVSGDASYTSSFYSSGDINNTAIQEVDDFFVVNASLGYRMENVSATFYVKNLFDEQYLTSTSPTGTSAAVGDSRSFGFEVKLNL